MSPITRESLILRLPTAGDASAWQEFSAIYEPLVYEFGRRRGLQDADARELVQDVFVAIARAVDGWKPDPKKGKFRAWLFRIARNELITMYRRRRPDRGTGKTTELMALQQIQLDESDNELELDYQRELFRAAAAFVKDNVHETTWQAFWRTSVEGHSIEATANELGLTCGAVYIARSRVLHRLRELIQQWEDDDASNT